MGLWVVLGIRCPRVYIVCLVSPRAAGIKVFGVFNILDMSIEQAQRLALIVMEMNLLAS